MCDGMIDQPKNKQLSECVDKLLKWMNEWLNDWIVEWLKKGQNE